MSILRPGDNVRFLHSPIGLGVVTKVDTSTVKVWWFDIKESCDYPHKEAVEYIIKI